MIEIHIEIGEAKTLDCENWKFTLDDRQTTIQTMNGNVVQDYGHIESGDKITCTCKVSKKNKELIFGYWNSRQLVKLVDEAGAVYDNMRVKVLSYGYVKMFEQKKYYWIDLEFWRI